MSWGPLKRIPMLADRTDRMPLFRFGSFHVEDLAVPVAAALGVLLAAEAIKPLWRTGFRS